MPGINEPKKIAGEIYVEEPPVIDANNAYNWEACRDSGMSKEEEKKVFDQANKLKKLSEDFRRIYQEEALIFLLTADREWFEKQGYTGERSREGYLIKGGEETAMLPSQNVGSYGLATITKRALDRFTAKRREIEAVLNG